MKSIQFRRLARGALAAISVAAVAQVAHAAWPNDKPIELVVGFAPGGGTDLMARKIAPYIQKRLGDQAQIIVINKPGASGEISNAYIANAKPDGYTIGIINVPHFLFVPMVKKANYKPEDLLLLSRVVDDPTILAVRADSKLNSLADVVNQLKSAPRSVSVGHNGTGSNGELAALLVNDAAKVEFNAIPYKGTSAQKTDLMGNHVDLAAISAGEVPELHDGKIGQLRAVAQFTATRSKALPNVQTATEAGFPVKMSSERGFAAPKAISPEIAKKIEAAIAEAVKDPAFLAASPADVPVLAYLSGKDWTSALEQNKRALRLIADKMPK